MWIKRVLTCSAALTGVYLYFNSKYVSINFWTKHNEEASQNAEVASYIYLPEIPGNDVYDFSSSFWSKNSVPVYWNLLMLCKSKDQKIRRKAVKSLSKLPPLEKWQYMMIAQACDMQTSVGLSRSIDASPYFFLSPPFRDLNGGNLQAELFNFMSILPPSNDVCIQNFRRMVVKSGKWLLQKQYSLDLEEGDPSVLFHFQQKKKVLHSFNKHVLQIFLNYSSTSSYRSLMVEKGILKLLLKVQKYYEDESEIQSLIGQILANFAMEEKLAKSIFVSGWIGILASWAKSSNLAVCLPAAKALANLDKDDVSCWVYDDGVYVLNPLFRESEYEPSADVIFVHGLLGGTFWTWRQCDTQKKVQVNEDVNENGEHLYALKNNSHSYSMCWPKDWLAVDIPSLRIISIDYKTRISNWSSYCLLENDKDSITKKSKELRNKLLLSNVGERPIIWIAHSMGGLIVKQILAEAFESKENNIKQLAQNTSGIIFYSVPHKGSEVVKKINSASLIFLPSSDIAQLGKDSPTLLSLDRKFKSIVSKYKIPVLSFGETKKSHWGLTSSVLVSTDSSDPGVGEFYALPVNHLSTCKPVSSVSSEYLKVVDFVQKNLSNTVPCDAYFLRFQKVVFEMSKVLCLIP